MGMAGWEGVGRGSSAVGLLLVCTEASRSTPRGHGASWVGARALRSAEEKGRISAGPGGWAARLPRLERVLLREAEWRRRPRVRRG